ncbi:AGC/PDK1 protein kinase [Coniosporium apollinis CBS 100218]|uniref:non-specific serine/threonine protein kinase n=1 Tax=Coniosporium apollinis (strain CBS 100218) TaxID=1168221 RepID=R7Z031_CONA1|nr:AGC/PDK1 protein kinase [Coniosporium apollinis CBS 100218]EON67507.1 AGC/PDK1 protein kinase [Coniosporium apollinis CBS 100218]
MNGDISLSQSLGGLRIANPDEDNLASPQSPPERDPTTSMDPPPPSSHSSSSTITERQRSHVLPAIESELPSSSLGFNASTFSTDSTLVPQPQSPPFLAEQPFYTSRLSHRQSMPLAHQAQQQMQYPTHPGGPPNPGRNYIGAPGTSPRPMSGFYNHPNLSSSSEQSGRSRYRYNDDTPPQASSMGRSNSRAAAAGMQAAGIPTRELSRNSRSYPPNAQMLGGNGPAPPRRSSRRIPTGQSPPGVGPPLGSPYGGEGGPLASSEEWKDKGAAVGIRQEVDADGRPVNRVVKKGVKDFNFGRTLGEGSYSTVLAATDRQTLREYAIKVLDKRHIIKEKKVKYVNIEKDTLNRLTDHPGIVRLYYTFQDERSLYFVLDLASGGELLGFLKKMGTFDEECTRFYGAQILDAIGYMHSRGVIHRDLKPENVLLDSQMHVKITDFGTAKILDMKRPNGSGAMAGDPMDGADTDRAVSFVGTAEYVSPELLTDKNACKASDLWAFGCIIYQLLAGRPPFKAGNEYLTFQKIVALEYSYPDGFPDVARDLVDRLLVLDPAKRLPIEHIKNHQFFDGISWGPGLWKQKAPRLRSYVPPAAEPIRLNGPSTAGPPPPPAAVAALRPQPRLITELPPPSQLDIDWSPVLTRNNERILKLGNLIVTSTPQPHSPTSKNGDTAADTPKKFSRFFGGTTTKKRQRLVMITSSARIIMAAAGGDEKKAKMEVSLLGQVTWKSYKDAKGLTAWCVDTRDKHLVFEDPKATTSDPDGSKYSAAEWLEAIERAKEFAISTSMTNSYSGDSTFNDLSSSLSSPSSTIGGDGALEGVNVPTARHLRKDPDSDSVKGRKRFSKRHSKNGLAAVF